MAGLTVQSEVPKGVASTVVLALKGDLDADTASRFQEQVDSARARGMVRFILDLEHVHTINSTGFSCLTNLSDALAEPGGEVILVRASQKVRLVLEMLGLNDRFKTFAALEEAMDYVRAIPRRVSPGDVTRVLVRKPEVRDTRPPAQEPEEMEILDIPDDGSKPALPTITHEKVSEPVPTMANREKKANDLECRGCKGIIQVRDLGTYKCPRCYTVFTMIAPGKANFLSRRKIIPVTMTLGLTDSGIHGASVMAGLLGRDAGFEAKDFEEAVRNILACIRKAAYRDNPHNVCHLQYLLTDEKLEMNFTHYGERIVEKEDDKEKENLFDAARRLMDHFELKPQEGSGSMITVSKLRPVG